MIYRRGIDPALAFIFLFLAWVVLNPWMGLGLAMKLWPW